MQIGVAVVLNDGSFFAINDTSAFPLMSVIKFHQALAVADFMSKHKVNLTDNIEISTDDMIKDTWSPMREKYPELKKATIDSLLHYSLVYSDNIACDVLFRFLGNGNPMEGTNYVNDYFKSLGFSNTEIIRTEDDMHSDLSLCYDNYSSPYDAALVFHKFFSTLKNDETSAFIFNCLSDCQTGKNRISKGITQSDIVVCNKTGTGPKNSEGKIIGINDVAFVRFPDGRFYTIAILIKDSENDFNTTENIIAEISNFVFNAILNIYYSRALDFQIQK